MVRTVHVGSASSELQLKKILREAERIKLGESQKSLFGLKKYD